MEGEKKGKGKKGNKENYQPVVMFEMLDHHHDDLHCVEDGSIDVLLTAVGTVTTKSFGQSTRDPHFHGRVPQIGSAPDTEYTNSNPCMASRHTWSPCCSAFASSVVSPRRASDTVCLVLSYAC